MITRHAEDKIIELTKYFPCVAIIGSRQVGKTTLVKKLISQLSPNTSYFDLELEKDRNKLSDAENYFQEFPEKNFIIDEVQRDKKLFPVLRAIIDQNKRPGRFILLGSASPDLIRDSSESLAGRIAYYELFPLLMNEVGNNIERLWIKGGYPDAFLENIPWFSWMDNFVKTYIEKDLRVLGFPGKSTVGLKLWKMITHYHGNLVNYSELGRSLDLSDNTVKEYIYFMQDAFLVRIIEPYFANTKKRLVKSPKIYIRDSGILHFLSGIETSDDLIGHPKMGASWEGFVIEQIIALLPANMHPYFYRTHDGSEIDLVIEKGGIPIISIEIKYGSKVIPSRGNTMAVQNLNTKNNFIIIKDNEDFLYKDKFRICGLETFLNKYLPPL